MSIWEIFFYVLLLGWILMFTLTYLPWKHSMLRFNARFALFYSIISTGAFVHIPYSLLHPKNVYNLSVISVFFRSISYFLGIKYEIRNRQILEEERGCVVISNHQSTLDGLGLLHHWTSFDKCTAIVKKEMFYVWPFGLCAWLDGIVFIDRSNKKAAYRTLQITTDVMVKNKTKIWIFPEGTRNMKTTGELLEFKKGAFAMAVAAQVPIIPVVFSPYYFLNRKTHFFDSKSRVIMKVLDPIETKGKTEDDIPDLIKQSMEIMSKNFKELVKEVTENLPSDYPGMWVA